MTTVMVLGQVIGYYDHLPCVFEDDTAEHQIRIRRNNAGVLVVSCTCLPRGQHIEGRQQWTVPEVLTAYRTYHGGGETSG